MKNFAEEIERAASELGESIEAVVIGDWFGEKNQAPPVPKKKIGRVLSWDEAKRFLNYAYRNSYGYPRVHPIFAWTPSYVLFVEVYDGAISLDAVPRHPKATDPFYVGGW